MTLIILRVLGLPYGSSINIGGTLDLRPMVLANIWISFSAGSNPEVEGGERGAEGGNFVKEMKTERRGGDVEKNGIQTTKLVDLSDYQEGSGRDRFASRPVGSKNRIA